MVDLRRYNSDTTLRKKVLQIIFEKRSITRNELSKITGISLTSVTKFVGSLIADGIVIESGALESTGGRRSSLVSINPEYAYIIGVDLGGYSTKLGIVKMDGSVLGERFIKTKDSDIVPVVGFTIDELINNIEELITEHGEEKLMAICVGVSGMVDYNKGRIIFCPNISGWNDLTIADILNKRFGVPVFVDTSARCMALAEQHFGAGRGFPDQFFISLGTYSIASALIINSQLFRGSFGFSGEIGHVMSSNEGVLCTCGNYDCLELSATLKVIIDNIYYAIRNYNGFSPLRQMLPSDPSDWNLTPELVLEAIRKGDKQCYQTVMYAAKSIGIALSNMLNILNLELIILGGGVIELFPNIIVAITETIKERAAAVTQNNIKIKKAELGWRGSIIGSATLALVEFFK
jgi:predicted NBD/HSP70 family sugar kinase